MRAARLRLRVSARVGAVLAIGLTHLCMAGRVPAAAPPNSPGPSTIIDPVGEGRQLAARLRDSQPAEPSEVQGMLEILPRTGPPTIIPITCAITLGSNSWQAAYTIRSTNSGAGAQVTPGALKILHQPSQPTVYRWAGANQGADTPANLNQPFAGSDFWVQDLGLEFLHWPTQRVIRAEMRRNRACRILQSTPAQPAPSTGSGQAHDGYARVWSWIDTETGGVIQAEAYDAQGKVLKKFALGSFEKVQGHWQLRNMKMRNLRTGSSTDLKFDLNQPDSP
jgi:hypothetical protein